VLLFVRIVWQLKAGNRQDVSGKGREPERSLIFMPKKKKTENPFTAEELAEYKNLLLQERNKIIQRVRGSSHALESSRQAGEESADVGGDDFIRETGIAMMSAGYENLEMIDAALKCLENGTYGICQDCHKPIGTGRLHAKPYAKYCIDCKEKREKNGGRGPDEL